MIEPELQDYLLGFALTAIVLLVFWKLFRKLVPVGKGPFLISRPLLYHRMKRVSTVYKIILGIFVAMTMIYSFWPRMYYIFLPLDQFNIPAINFSGLLILKIAIVWIVIAQIHIDKELYKYSRDLNDLGSMELVRYSEKMLHQGILILFMGFFTTITNIIGLLMVLIGILAYSKVFQRK